MKKNNLFASFFLIFSFCGFSQISFENPCISLNNEVLFTLNHKTLGSIPYSSIFYAKLENQNVKNHTILTCFPEQMELLNEGKILQIRNRFGTAIYDDEKNHFEWKNQSSQIPENCVHINEFSVSPNGKFICKIESKSLTSGKLILENIQTGKSFVLCEDSLNSYSKIPVKWSFDSSVLIYEKNENLYFCNPEAIFNNVEIDEKYRKIGRGTINCINWASEKYLAYIDDYIIYRIHTKELYTLGLYSGIIGQGKAMGRLPFRFDKNLDSFSANNDVSAILLIQNNRLFSYFKIKNISCDYVDVVYSQSYTDSSASLVDSYIFWDSNQNPIIWNEKLPYDNQQKKNSVYKITNVSKQVLEIQNAQRPFLSPDNRKVAFVAGNSLFVYNVNSWSKISELSGENIVSCIWKDNNTLFVGGEKTIRKWNCSTKETKIITLSQAKSAIWNENSSIIFAQTNDLQFYKFNQKNNTWNELQQNIINNNEIQNGNYRIFIGKSQNQKFVNALYFRTLTGKSDTNVFFEQTQNKKENPKKVSLVFDLYDNPDGLPQIISTLQKYNIKATFFINGEFIRRYPSETKQLTKNNFDCASMFFTTTKLTDENFIINEDFIRRGLARNEDEFYSCTQKELLLYWHAPYYSTTPKINEFVKKSGYSIIEPNIDYLQNSELNKSCEQIILQYFQMLKNEQKIIIPIIAGFSGNDQKNHLYKNLDLLINVFLQENCEFVGIE